jgi:hypothetical protein
VRSFQILNLNFSLRLRTGFGSTGAISSASGRFRIA